MNKDRFFLGFFAALRAHDLDFVDTRFDRHHVRFKRVVTQLKTERTRHRAGSAKMPRALVPNPYNARYKEFDQALIKLQKGDLGAHNPHYPGVSLVMDKRRAEEILGQFDADERELFLELANTYLTSDAPDSLLNAHRDVA